MTATSEPYIDPRRVRLSRPFAVTLRSASGGLVEIHHFVTARDAWAFYQEHRA